MSIENTGTTTLSFATPPAELLAVALRYVNERFGSETALMMQDQDDALTAENVAQYLDVSVGDDPAGNAILDVLSRYVKNDAFEELIAA